MGKGMTFKRANKPLTEREWQKRERAMQKRFDFAVTVENQMLTYRHNQFIKEQKADITGSASELAELLFLVATNRVYNFDHEGLMKIVDEIGAIQDMLKSGAATWWDVRYEAEQLGFVVANENGYLETEEREDSKNNDRNRN